MVLTCDFAAIKGKPIITMIGVRHCDLLFDSGALDAQGSDPADATGHDELLFRAKIDLEVLD